MITTEATTAPRALGAGRGGRMSRRRKRDSVLQLLRGEDLETVSRALGVTAATLTTWRQSFLAGGEAALASRPADGETLETDPAAVEFDAVAEIERTAAGMRKIVNRNAALRADGLFDEE